MKKQLDELRYAIIWIVMMAAVAWVLTRFGGADPDCTMALTRYC